MIDQRQESEIKSKAYKFLSLISLTAFLFSILLSRLFFLQIYQGEALKDISNSNRFKTQILVAPRGLILDRKGKLLAGHKKTFQLIVNTHSPQLPHILNKISSIIETPVPDLMESISKKQKRYSVFHPIVLKENLSLKEIHLLKQLEWLYSEVQVEQIETRYYPLKENASGLLGFIGPISRKEIQKFKTQKKQFYLSDIVGKSGLEKQYNNLLKGQNGFSMLEVDAQNRLSLESNSSYFDFLKIDSIQGKNLHLTLDKELQEASLKALQKKDSLFPRKGAVVVMKTNGEILALLSHPSYNPNQFHLGVTEEIWQKWSSSKVFINKVYQEHYSPGSVFKPFLALAALQENIITEETLVDSPGRFKVGRRFFHDHNRLGYGKINVITAIERSANTFFYQMGYDLGIEKIIHYSKLFGFGQKTQISLPSEVSGYIPKLSKKTKWIKGNTINISIGQGSFLTSLLQLAVAYNVIATEGLLVKPFVVKQKGESIQSPVILDTISDRIDRKHFITIKKALYNVVHGSKGTAKWYQLPFVSFSGKTGTAQVVSLDSKKLYEKCSKLPLEKRHHGWFISFAPSEQTEIVVAVFTEHSCSGSKGSAGVARDIIEYYFKTYLKNKEGSNSKNLSTNF